jgi:hypothetical protein
MRRRHLLTAIASIVMLVGIGLIFLLGIRLILLLGIGSWPLILIAIGLAILPISIIKNRLQTGLQSSLELIGIGLIFLLDIDLWPGILIVAGLIAIVSAFIRFR